MEAKSYIFGTLLSLPFIGLLFYVLNPPQCPAGYTQEQVDASRCIIGANIGGIPIFIIAAIVAWFAAVWPVDKLGNEKAPRA